MPPPTSIPLNVFTGKIFDAIGLDFDDIMAMINLIGLRDYKRIRKNINEAIGVGDIEKFTGFVADETEHADITDVFIYLLRETYPGVNFISADCGVTLTHDEQVKFRDELIKRLDEMVER